MIKLILNFLLVFIFNTAFCQLVKIKVQDPDKSSVQFTIVISSDSLIKFSSDKNGILIIEKEKLTKYKDQKFELTFPSKLYNTLYENILCDSTCAYPGITGEPYLDGCNCNNNIVEDLLKFTNEKIFYVPRQKIGFNNNNNTKPDKKI